jgi:hypothetical protein
MAGSAHPEDEFCVPGETSLDPELCAALAERDSASTTADLRPLRDAAGNERSALSTAGLYIVIGIRHILPAGLDHILFVLALVLGSASVRALVIQLSTFTVAHTVTLGLAAAGYIAPQASIVEPLIAASIAFVAFENLSRRNIARWRPIIVFGFGLVHGLGFAGFFGELGLPPGQFLSALIGFNIGVEAGQLAVVAVAFVAARVYRSRLAGETAAATYRSRVVVPASLAIAAIGLYWTFTRVLGQLA